MRSRSKMPRKKSKKLFSKTAQAVKSVNHHSNPMRGGWRL